MPPCRFVGVGFVFVGRGIKMTPNVFVGCLLDTLLTSICHAILVGLVGGVKLLEVFGELWFVDEAVVVWCDDAAVD